MHETDTKESDKNNDNKIVYVASIDTVYVNNEKEEDINLNDDETGDINMEANNKNINENKSDDEKIEEKEEIIPIKPPDFIKCCEEYLLDITKRFSNLYTSSEKHSEV